jgi:crotonobetainyl-CoA:carnitine CoA-transferase CaiB-like acyl-CoA transferase
LLNRGKQSVALDLKSQEGQAIAVELASGSNVVVEGFRPGVAARLGIDFPVLAAHNGRLVYCSISGYGQEDPLRGLPGHDLTYAALSGFLEALFPGAPRVPGVQLVDAAAALVAAIRILAALHAVGEGPQYLDVTLVDAAQTLMPVAIAEACAGDSQGPSMLDVLRGSARNNVYRCADDRWLAVAPLEEPFWERLCALLRREGLLEPGEAPSDEALRAVFARRSAQEWFSHLAEAGVPCGPVIGVEEGVQRRAQVAFPGFAGLMKGELPVPVLGEHTACWLEALGYSQEQIAGLEAKGIVRTIPLTPSPSPPMGERGAEPAG